MGKFINSEPRIIDREYYQSHRFCLITLRTRFDDYDHFVTDAETVTDDDVKNGKSPETVFQSQSYNAARQWIVKTTAS